MAKKAVNPQSSNWDRIKSRAPGDTIGHRDVFENQQLERSKIDKIKTKTSRNVLTSVTAGILMILVWLVLSGGMLVVSMISTAASGMGDDLPVFYEKQQLSITKFCYQPIDDQGAALAGAPCYATEQDAKSNPPQWWLDLQAQEQAAQAAADATAEDPTFGDMLLRAPWWKLLITLGAGLSVFGVMQPVLMRNLAAQNLMNDTTDINQYTGDQHIALPDEIMRKFEWFPDSGMHGSAQVSSMISHIALTNKGLKKIEVSRRAETDILDDDGDVEYLRGEILRDDNGNILTQKRPMIDEAFGEALFDASEMPKDKTLRKRYNATDVAYNPDGSDREKLGKYNTFADLINADWIFPEYEVQPPSGVYIVDTAPVNTMVLAITRAGKGQTYIEPVIDMWLRERCPNNMVINDPKGELLVKNYVRATLRGFQVIQFNLINSMKTDIYNPLGMAADAAREGDSPKCALYVENIAEVFFPTDGGEDPVWPNAANNAFKRAAYGLIDYYLEEERELRAHAAISNMDPKVLDKRLDEMWGKVTLYNCYQLFVQLTSKKSKNPIKALAARVKGGEFGDPNDSDSFDVDAYEPERAAAEKKAFLWDDADEVDLLTLFFNASAKLPRNSMRKQVANADNALRAMGGAEKMLASVYGIALTAMSFFTDPTISTLTSGTPSQNTDLGGLSFPRRMGVRFGANYLTRYHLIGAQAKWDAYADATFTQPLGKDFEHDDIVSREGWARYYFKGKFEADVAYVRLRLVNAQTGMLLQTFYFRFTKDYQTSFNGRSYITDPITGKKIVKHGILVELKENVDGTAYNPGHTTYKQARLTNVLYTRPEKEEVDAHAIISTTVRYSDKPKAVFLVTPPHLMKYAKLVLILLKQLVDLNFDKSYMTKSDQKPLYKTRYMLDELGNLQSDKHGISGFETMLSIGLGQEQQFTIILQTLQQLRDVYGESVDKIVQGNTSNIVFLKSTDDSMIDTLQKMSGIHHVVRRKSKTVTKDMERIVQALSTEGKASYTMEAVEEPVISYNDLAFISKFNSVVFRAGDSPVWNRNETVLPMSWRLFKDLSGGSNGLVHPGHEYSLQTIPTLSTAIDFDVRLNQPNFDQMLAKRIRQAEAAESCEKMYQEAFGYEDVDIARLDIDVYSDEIMALIDVALHELAGDELGIDPDEVDPDAMPEGFYDVFDAEADFEMRQARQAAEAIAEERRRLIYAGQQVNKEMLVRGDGRGQVGALDRQIVEAYKASRAYMERDAEHFSVGAGGALRSADGATLYIERRDDDDVRMHLATAAQDENTRVYAEGDIAEFVDYEVTAEFYKWLASHDSWHGFADGQFDRAMTALMRGSELVSV